MLAELFKTKERLKILYYIMYQKSFAVNQVSKEEMGYHVLDDPVFERWLREIIPGVDAVNAVDIGSSNMQSGAT